MDELNITYKTLDEIKPYENNPRLNDDAVEPVMNSIKEFGFKCPIVLDKDNVIVAGHTRYKAAKKLKMKRVPCVVADDLTPEQVRAFRLADNKTGELADWDFNMLGEELGELDDFNMERFGFDGAVTGDGYSDDFSLSDADKGEFCQMTFHVHQRQKELIDYVCKQVKDEVTETFGNPNENGNELYEVVRQWAEQRK